MLAVMEPATEQVDLELPQDDDVADARATMAVLARWLITLRGRALGSDSQTKVLFATVSPASTSYWRIG